MIIGLDHAQVAAPVGCEHAAREFYGRWLGLEEIEKPPLLAARGGVWFRVGAQQLHVGATRDFVAATKAHPALRVSSAAELERLAVRLESHGVTVSRPDPAEIPQVVRLHVLDPWGNRVELLA
jgi:catechol 2,3-dioxygenase-like lactoylglutathione lyase family enzyme